MVYGVGLVVVKMVIGVGQWCEVCGLGVGVELVVGMLWWCGVGVAGMWATIVGGIDG